VCSLWIEQSSFALQANVSTSFTKNTFSLLVVVGQIPLTASFRILLS
jgi:hypothetical protein